MKRALLWLGPLACLALACLYAYVWFSRDPLAVAFERIEVGMRLEEVVATMGRPAEHLGKGMKVDNGIVLQLENALWSNEYRTFQVFIADGHVVSTNIICMQETFTDKIYNWVSDPLAPWRAPQMPAVYAPPSVPVPAAATPVPQQVNAEDEP
jgi:hypothetical protein